MHIFPCKTHRIQCGESLVQLLDSYVPSLKEGSILALTSKIISLCEGRIVPRDAGKTKQELIKEHAEAYLEADPCDPHNICLTIKNHLLIPSAGIDESNGNGVYILYPQDVQVSATLIWTHLRQRDGIENLGVIITDSRTTPLRRGVTGVGIGWCGFKPLYNYIGRPDCFGRPLYMTQINNLDALAAAAVFCMGEGNEQTPFAIIEDPLRIEFQARPPLDEELEEITISLKNDLYAPLLKHAPWKTRLK